MMDRNIKIQIVKICPKNQPNLAPFQSLRSLFKPKYSLTRVDQAHGLHRNVDNREGPIKQTADKLVISATNYTYNLPFAFTGGEIQEAFSTLDIHQTDYITADEVRFFLDILGEEATDAEIGEMINMLDIQGTGKVYFEQFLRMAKGQSLSPIGVAYPPAIRHLGN